MSHDASADHGTVLRPDQSALVLDPDGAFRLLLANEAEDAPASRGLVLLAAIAVKLNDQDFIDGLFEAVTEAHRELQ